jgi:hypothetical protein
MLKPCHHTQNGALWLAVRTSRWHVANAGMIAAEALLLAIHGVERKQTNA